MTIMAATPLALAVGAHPAPSKAGAPEHAASAEHASLGDSRTTMIVAAAVTGWCDAVAIVRSPS